MRSRYLGVVLKRARRDHPDWKIPFPNKLDLACELIDWAVKKGYCYPVVIDSWYTCRQVCEHITSKKMIYVGTVQPDNGVYFKGKWISIKDWHAQLPDKAFEPVRFRYRQRETIRTWHQSNS